MADSGKSIAWIVSACVLVVIVVGWGFLAGAYTGAHTPSLSESDVDPTQYGRRSALRRARRQAVVMFFTNSVEQLPNLPTVIAWNFSHRIWLPATILLALGGVLGGGLALKRVEQHLNQPPRRRRH